MPEQLDLWTPAPPGRAPAPPRVSLAPDASLEDARAYVRQRLDDGVECPCCGRLAKRYVIKLNSTIAAWLVALTRITEQGNTWAHAREASACVVGAGASAVGYAYLQHWGLVEQADKDAGRSGHWRPTDFGVEFVRNRVLVPKCVVLWNNRLEGFGGELVTIRDALGSRFDLKELMAARPTDNRTEDM